MTMPIPRTQVRTVNTRAFRSRLMMSAATLAALSLASAAKADEIGAMFRDTKFSGLSDGTFIPDRDMPLTSVDGFVPLIDTGHTLFFSDMSGAMREGDAQGSVALGLRTDAGAGWVLGAWASYDRERSALSGEAFDGVAFGVEAFNGRFDMRLRAVVPDSGDRALATGDAEIVGWGENTKVRTHWEKALAGVETEFGWRAFTGAEDGFDLRVYAGLFSFSGDGVAITGTKTGFESRIADLALFGLESRLSLSGEIAYDEERDATGYFGLHLEIPFADDGDNNWEYDALPLFETRLRQSLNSFVMTSTTQVGTGFLVGGTDRVKPRGCEPNPRKGITCSVPFTVWYADAQGDGDGSFGNPESIINAVALAGLNGVVAAIGSTPIDVGRGVRLSDGQYLVGGGTAFKLLVGSVTVTGTTQGTRGTLSTGGAGIIVSLANNNWIENLDFEGGFIALEGFNISSGTFRNLTIGEGAYYTSFSSGIQLFWGKGGAPTTASVTIDDVDVSGHAYGLYLGVGPVAPTTLDVSISNSDFHNNVFGIRLGSFDPIVDFDVTLNGTRFAYNFFALDVYVGFGGNISITGDDNDFVYNVRGATMTADGAGSTVDVDLDGTYFYENDTNFDEVEASGGAVTYDFN